MCTHTYTHTLPDLIGVRRLPIGTGPPFQDGWGLSCSPHRGADILVPTHLLRACDPGQHAVFGTLHIRTCVISGSWDTSAPLPCLLPSLWTRSHHTLLGGLFRAEGPVIQPQPVRSGRLCAAAGTGSLTRCGFSRMQDVGTSGGRHPLGMLEVMVAETWGWGADRMLLPHIGRSWVSTVRRENSHLQLHSAPAHCSPSPGMNHFP